MGNRGLGGEKSVLNNSKRTRLKKHSAGHWLLFRFHGHQNSGEKESSGRIIELFSSTQHNDEEGPRVHKGQRA